MTAATSDNNHNDDNYECDYMKERAERIRKNEEYLASLGLSKVKKNLLDMTKKTKRTLRRERSTLQKSIKPGKERRSSRLSSKQSKSKHVMLSYDDEDDTKAVEIDSDDDYSSDDDNHDDHHPRPQKTYPHHPHRRYTRFSPKKNVELTVQERHVLTQVDDNFLSKFQEFLVFHNKISPPNVRNVMRQVGKLVSGEGIRYESPKYGWPPECVFMMGQKITPMSDFVMLMQEGQECEDKWGRDHGNGWLLSHPLKKMLLFQQFALNNPDFLTAKCKLVDYYALDDDEAEETTTKDDDDDNNNNTTPQQEQQVQESMKKEETATTSTPPKKRVKKSSPPPQKRKKTRTKQTTKAEEEQTNRRVGLRKRRKLL